MLYGCQQECPDKIVKILYTSCHEFLIAASFNMYNEWGFFIEPAWDDRPTSEKLWEPWKNLWLISSEFIVWTWQSTEADDRTADYTRVPMDFSQNWHDEMCFLTYSKWESQRQRMTRFISDF
jgi:hypothetical protein